MSAIFSPLRLGNSFRAKMISVLPMLVLLSACQRAAEPPTIEVRPVRTVTIEQRAIGSTVTLTGRVQAQTEVNQSFRIDGKLIERNVDIGDKVVPGTLLGRLDSLNEESNLQSAQAQLAAARAQWLEASSSYTRMRDLLAEDAVSRAAFERAEAQLKVAQSQVDSVQSMVTLAQNRLGYTRLVSTVAGVVTARGPEPGEVVQAGRTIVQIAQEGAREAVFDVPAQVRDSVSGRPDITVALSSDPSVTATGQVSQISPRADPVTGTFNVRVRLRSVPAAMRLGSTVTGNMQLTSTPGIELPTSALTQANEKPAVWIVDPASSTVSMRPVTVRAFDATHVQIEAGLTPGDVVVTAGVQTLRPGQKVRSLEVQP